MLFRSACVLIACLHADDGRLLQPRAYLSKELVGLVGVYPFAMMNQVIIAYHVRARGELKLSAELAASKYIAVEKLRPWEFGTGAAVKDWLARGALTPGGRARPEAG